MDEKWFGSVYGGVGSTSKDLILKTKGLIKIQVGKKFIDLLDKNGKVASSSNNEILKEINSLDEINLDGIYVLDGNVYIRLNDNTILLGGDGGLVYLSYISLQNITPEQKNIAKKNLGLLFDTLEEAINSVDTGLVFIGDKIYYISGASYSEFKGEFPNPFKDLLVIQKNNSKNGSILIKGDSFLNGISFNDSSHIYEENKKLHFDNQIGINLLINNSTILELSTYSANFKIPIISDSVRSNEFKEGQSGFILRSVDGYSTLEVDKIVERDSQELSILFEPILYSKLYLINDSDVVFKDRLENDNAHRYLTEIKLETYPSYTLNDNDIVLINYFGDVVKINLELEKSTETTNYVFELMYNSSDNKFVFVTWDDLLEKYVQIEYEISKMNESNYINIDTNKYLLVDNLSSRIIGKHLFVKAELSNSNKFKIDYNSASISIEENIPSDSVSGVVLSDTHAVIGNVLEYTTESTRRSELGVYTDQAIINGAEFRGPFKKELVTKNTNELTQEELAYYLLLGIDVSGLTFLVEEKVYRNYDFPRYSSELATNLQNQGSSINNNIIPNIAWTKDYVNSQKVLSNWNETDPLSWAYIQNKPTHISELDDDSSFIKLENFIFCTQSEYNELNSPNPDSFYIIIETSNNE